MMKRLLLLFFLNTLFFNLFALKDTTAITYDFGGFFKYDAFYDSRKNVAGIEGLLLLYPQQKNLNSEGYDYNANAQLNFLSVSSRLNFSILPENFLNARTKVFFEVDFTAMSNTNSIRLRHAYAELKWKSAQLLICRFWHPLFTEEAYPSVISLNLGAPFQPFNRSEQLRFTYRQQQLFFMFSASYQSAYVNDGPDGRTAMYLSQALLPNLSFQTYYKSHNLLLGLGYDYKRIRPFMHVTSLIQASELANKEFVNGNSFLAFFKFQKSKFLVKGKLLLGQNLTDHYMLGGYGINEYNLVEGRILFSKISNLSTWLNVVYGNQLKFGLFAGYTESLGSNRPFVEQVDYLYMTEPEIKSIYRISPQLSYKKGNWMIALENEYTLANYGSFDYETGKVTDTEATVNTRLLFSLFYFF